MSIPTVTGTDVDNAQTERDAAYRDYINYLRESDTQQMVEQAKTAALTLELNDLSTKTNMVLNSVVEWKKLADQREENSLAATLGIGEPNQDVTTDLQNFGSSFSDYEASQVRQADTLSNLTDALNANEEDPIAALNAVMGS